MNEQEFIEKDLWVKTFLAVIQGDAPTLSKAIGWANEAVDNYKRKFKEGPGYDRA